MDWTPVEALVVIAAFALIVGALVYLVIGVYA